MSLNRITRERLYQDETVFNQLLPFARYDEEQDLFVHSDASLWSLWELQPKWITSTSDGDAYKLCESVQEMLDALEHRISAQFCWITTFDVDRLLKDSKDRYPSRGVAGWMASRWIRSIRQASHSSLFARRPRKLRLVVAFRYDPPWRAVGFLEQIKRTVSLLLHGSTTVSASQRKAEYLSYAVTLRGIIDGNVQKLRDLGFGPRRIDGQGIINLLYPLLNRKNVRPGKFRRGRNTSVPVPVYDPKDFLSNQISDTPVEHPQNGLIRKNGRVYRSVSLVKHPKRCLPLMITPLLSSPYENIVSVSFSKDTKEAQMKMLDQRDGMLGRRERTFTGRSNQKIQHQISAVRAARDELYSARSQLVRCGVHQTFICQNEDEAVRAAAEAIATFPQLHGARGMVHEISDLAVIVNSLPGCYDPSTDGAGWTNVLKSSQAVRMFPLWGNWRGSHGPLFVLPSLWNRELVGFDFYDSNVAPNVLISGVSGAGKSYLLCYILITMQRGHYATLTDGRTVEREPITFVFDKGMTGQPCGFEKVAQLFNGKIYEATPSRAPAMNFLGKLGQINPDSTNEDYKDYIELCADIICDMANEQHRPIERLDKQSVSDSVIEAHRLYRSGPMRREFILSDVVAVLRAPKRVQESDESVVRRQRVAALIGDYYGDGMFSRFFDRPGSLTLKHRFIVFDMKALSRNPDLQRIFLKVSMLWADTVMNDPKELDARKILVFDEAHDLIGKTSAGTIETAFRLYRKRKGIVIAASQSGEDFYVGSGGQAIVQNSAHKIFLRQDPTKFHFTAQAFNLSQQQSDVILRLRTVKGIESQFYMLSDMGEGAFVLPLESAFYWASTNNGDDNQLFNDLLKEHEGSFWPAFQEVVQMAPNGAKARQDYIQQMNAMDRNVDRGVAGIVAGALDTGGPPRK